MSIVEFEAPSWMDGVSAKSIEQNMMSNLPADIDKTEGGWAWDLTYPTALEKAELLQFYLIRTLQIMHPMWADGRWLDYHATENGLERKPATYSYGTVTVTGTVGLSIDAGFLFAVPSDNGVAAIEFKTLAAAVIGSDGTVSINVQAVESGPGSNVGADTITIMSSPLSGIKKVTNASAITGGVIEETDDELRERIDELLAGNGDSYVGNNADYVRWAKEVAGVGYAHTIPEYHGPNSVKVIVVDSNGDPANDQIVKNVFTHIFGTNRKDQARLAPVGLIDFTVSAPAAVNIAYAFKLKLSSNSTSDSVVSLFKTALTKYYEKVSKAADDEDKVIKYVMVASLLANITGVEDFKDFTMNGLESNVTCTEEEYPVTTSVGVTTYE